MDSRLTALARVLTLMATVALAISVLGAVTSASAQTGTLALVYLNTEVPGTSEVWVAGIDGANQRTVATFGPGARALDVRGSVLAVAIETGVAVVDLADGEPKPITAPRVTSGYVTEQGSVLFATRAGCGPVETKAKIGRIDAATGAATDVVELASAGSEIVWHDPETDAFMLAPRGCDPGISSLRLYDGKTGVLTSSVEARGCGWVAVAPNGKQALISESCGVPGAPAFHAYDLPSGSQRDVRLTEGGLSSHAVVYAPDGSRVAFGTSADQTSPAYEGNRSGKAKSGGIWLLDAGSLAQTKLWQDEGLESWAIDWSPDGSKLLVASVEAQGRCRYFTVDVASGEAAPVEGITGCGTNGTLVGFATLP